MFFQIILLIICGFNFITSAYMLKYYVAMVKSLKENEKLLKGGLDEYSNYDNKCND